MLLLSQFFFTVVCIIVFYVYFHLVDQADAKEDEVKMGIKNSKQKTIDEIKENLEELKRREQDHVETLAKLKRQVQELQEQVYQRIIPFEI